MRRKAKGLGAKRQLVEEQESFMYVPILETLQTLLNDDSILAEVQVHNHTCMIYIYNVMRMPHKHKHA